MRKRVIHRATSVKDNYEDIKVCCIGLINNFKFELISHMVEAMRQISCDNNATPEIQEMLMKSCKVLFADINRRYHTVFKECKRSMKLYVYNFLQYSISEKITNFSS